MPSSQPRYALYFAPAPESALWRFGSQVLGYDGVTGEEVAQSVPAGVAPDAFHAATEDPRLYAFHATIKAPFRLAEGRSEADLVAALGDFARARRRFALPRLAVTPIGRQPAQGAFIALTEPEPTADLLALERDTVVAFEPFRAPLTAGEVAKRRPETLSARQRAYLDHYGYPYVHDEFRFHMTLTGRLKDGLLDAALSGLTALHGQAVPAAPVAVDALAIFRQAAPGERFRVMARCAFGA